MLRVPDGAISILLVGAQDGISAFATDLAQAILFIVLLAPYWLYKEADAEARIQLSRLKPKLRLSFAKDTGVCPINEGNVSESLNGRRQAVLTTTEFILRVACTNDSANRVDDCRAFLIGVKEVLDDGTLKATELDEAVELLWTHDLGSSAFTASLQPNVPKWIYVLMRRGHPALMLYRRAKDLRPEFAVLFDTGKKYRIWIQANGPNDVAARICMDVWAVDRPQGGGLPMDFGVEIISTGTGPDSNVIKVDTMDTYRA